MFIIINFLRKRTSCDTLLTQKALISVFYFVLAIVLPLETCPLWGQAGQKKLLARQDYHLWGDLELHKVSEDGKWASYTMKYEDRRDTLFVRNINSRSDYSFALGADGYFTKNSLFVCRQQKDLLLLNLRTGTKEIISNAGPSSYCRETDHLIILTGTAEAEKTLIIRSLKNSQRVEIKGVSSFDLSPKGAGLVYCTQTDHKTAVFYTNLTDMHRSKWIVPTGTEEFLAFRWQKQGRAMAFCSRSSQGMTQVVYYYLPEQDKLYKFNAAAQQGLSKNTVIVNEVLNRIHISDDLQKVFFSVNENNEKAPGNAAESGVEIWNANDKWTYQQDNSYGHFERRPKVAMWIPESNYFKIITSNELPKIMLTGDFNNAVIFNPKQNQPKDEFYGPMDFYIMDLHTFGKEILLKDHRFDYELLLASPGGKYFAYAKENNWWIYNIHKKTHTNLTASIGVKFTAVEGKLDPESIVGSPGWTLDDKEILLFDKYDIWAVAADGSRSRRLTHGREAKIKYRMADPNIGREDKFIFDGYTSRSIDIHKPLLLRAEGEDGKTGYFKWTYDSGEEAIVYTQSYVDELNHDAEKKKFVFREQRFDLSPRLAVQSKKEKITPFYQSNPQQEKYFWGTSQLIEYQNSKGDILKGALFYPAQYDPKIKYPMIVHIYERQSKELHKYVLPSENDGGGVNATIFTNAGYIFFLPDLQREDGNPGFSAADCVTAAVRKVIEMKIADPAKIGLMGHSFGGYETAFAITQTQLFAAAVAGGAITDLNSFYHSINSYNGRPEMWRFGTEQWAMQKTPYEAMGAYLSNSPLTHVKDIQIPLLLWAGKNDQQVDTHQSFEFYLALRRLGKKGIMLLYPDDIHALINPVNQIDLTNRVLQWFDFFLKGNRQHQWIEKGMQ